MNPLWTKALEAATDARFLVKAERFDAAANRSYYAMFNAARALLATRGIGPERAKTHETVLRLFSREFVKPGPFEERDGKALRVAGEVRSVADYGDVNVTAAKAAEITSAMDRFMERAANLLKQEPEA